MWCDCSREPLTDARDTFHAPFRRPFADPPAALLTSDAARFVTGVSLAVDGGNSIGSRTLERP